MLKIGFNILYDVEFQEIQLRLAGFFDKVVINENIHLILYQMNIIGVTMKPIQKDLLI